MSDVQFIKEALQTSGLILTSSDIVFMLNAWMLHFPRKCKVLFSYMNLMDLQNLPTDGRNFEHKETSGPEENIERPEQMGFKPDWTDRLLPSKLWCCCRQLSNKCELSFSQKSLQCSHRRDETWTRPLLRTCEKTWILCTSSRILKDHCCHVRDHPACWVDVGTEHSQTSTAIKFTSLDNKSRVHSGPVQWTGPLSCDHQTGTYNPQDQEGQTAGCRIEEWYHLLFAKISNHWKNFNKICK